MIEILWTAVFGAGIFQGIFLCATVLLRPHTNRRAARFLSALLALIALGLFAEMVQGALGYEAALYIAFLNINTELAFGPLIFLTLRSLLFPDRDCAPRDALHFLPLVLGIATWSIAGFYVTDPEALYVSGFHSSYPILEYVILKAAILFAYLAAAFRLMAKAAGRSERLYSGRHSMEIKTLQRWTMGLCAVPVSIYVVSIAETAGTQFRIGSDQIAGVLLCALIFLAAWLVISRPWVLSLKWQPFESRHQRHDSSLLSDYLRQQKPWLDPALSRAQLAEALGWSETHLSSVISSGLESGFYDLLNTYRLDEFERLARDPSRHRNIVLTLAFDSGFNSKAAFYRAFRNRHRVTPTRFRNDLLANLTSKTSH